MVASSPDIDHKFRKLRDRYADSLPGKVTDFRNRWANLTQAWQVDDAEELYRRVHSLCGSSGNYEALDLAAVARKLEQALLTIIYAERVPLRDESAEIEDLLDKLDQQAHRWAEQILGNVGRFGQESEVRVDNRLIYILNDDESPCLEIKSCLKGAGYKAVVASSPNELMAAYLERTPAAIVLMGTTVQPGSSIAEILPTLASTAAPPPLLVVGNADDVNLRLEAARVGISGFLAAPVEPERLRKTLDLVLSSRPAEPYRVLVVDDNENIATYHACVLQEAGLQVTVLSNPLDVLAELKKVDPDLVLMDVYMPGCSGPELAAVIRQDHDYAFLPIVFLSSETNSDKIISAMNLGGDDFLSKPIEPRHFRQFVLAKLKRSRWMRQISRELIEARKDSAFRKLALDHHAIVSTTDAEGWITSVNKKFCEVSGFAEEELVGRNHRIVNSGYHSKEFFEELWQTISTGNIWHGEICNRKKSGEQYWVASTIVPYLDSEGLPYQYVSIRTDITRNKLMERQLSENVELMEALREAMTQFMTEMGFHDVMELLLHKLIQITGSEYGFMGEVLYNEDQPYLKLHAINNTGWSKEARNRYERGASQETEFHNLGNLLRTPLRTGETIVCNDETEELVSGGFPGEHPPLKSFFAAPVYFGRQLIGLYGIANRREGYIEDWKKFLAPFGATYGVLIHSRRMTEMEHEVTDYLDRARTEAEQASRAKSEFLSSMSHELRTPLNVILGFAQLMTDDPDSELTQSHKENAEEILRAGDHLLGLVNEVLDLARIEAGRLSLEIGPVQVEPLIADCIALVQPLARNKSIYIDYDRAGCANILVEADITRLNQAILNYLSNAVKYVPEKGSVRVTCHAIGDERLRVQVRDNGLGIASKDHDRIFKPFSRVVAEGSSAEGAGIGLVITRRLIEEMGGTVGFESEQGKGATFWLELPIAKESPVSTVPPEHKQIALADTGPDASNQYRILYIEDNPANLNLVSQAIKRRPNISLLTALEPHAGLELARSHSLDAILLDINLPHMDGFEVMSRLHQDPVTRDIPIIAVSANAMPGDIANGIAAGFTDYVTKPIKLDIFFETIDRVLSASRS